MIVYLASPSNQMQADSLAGCYVLESFGLYAEAQWMTRFRPTFAGIMLDSGAYSVMSKGKKIDVQEYISYCKQHGAVYDKIVNLDVISGGVTERVDGGKANLQLMRDAGIDALPVFHQGEPWSVLEELASSGKVGLGFQRPIRCADEFLDECFSIIPSSTKVHGFAMTNADYTGRYPFDSVDSATIWYEYQALLSLSGQGSDVMQYQTPRELVEIILRKYHRLPMATAWRGKTSLPLFRNGETT